MSDEEPTFRDAYLKMKRLLEGPEGEAVRADLRTYADGRFALAIFDVASGREPEPPPPAACDF